MEKVIQKKFSHSQAIVIIKMIIRTFLSRNHYLIFLTIHHIIISVISQVSLISSFLDVLIIIDIIDMKFIQDEFFDTLNEIKEHFEDLESSIMIIIINILENRSQSAANIFIKSFVNINLIEAL